MVPNRHLKQARELRGWSQAKVAREIGTDATTVSRWERGLFSPTPYFRERLCTLFGKNAEELGLLESARQEESEWQGEDTASTDPLVLRLPAWTAETDTFAYILHSAAHDQQAHMLWKDAYVRALQGHLVEARELGEASLRAFECIGHVNARAVREWLNQQAFLSASSASASVASTSLSPAPSEEHRPFVRRFLPQKGAQIVLILMGSLWLLFLLDLPAVK